MHTQNTLLSVNDKKRFFVFNPRKIFIFYKNGRIMYEF